MMFRKAALTISIILVALSGAWAQQGLEELDLKDLFFEPYLPGVRPAFTNFSTDLERIYFSWNDSAYTRTSTYEVDLGGNNLARAARESITNYSFNRDNSLIVYTRGGELIVSDPELDEKRILIETKSGLSRPVWSPGGRKVAFEQGGDIWITSVDEPFLKQVTNNENNSPSFNLNRWIGDDRLLLESTDHSRSRTIYFPEYHGDFVIPGSATRGIPRTTFAVAELETGSIDTLISDRNRSSTSASLSGRYLAIDYADPALKHRTVKVFDFEEDTMNIVFEDSTEGWLHGTSIEFNPLMDVLMIQSEKDGWNHIYTVNADGSNFEQHTSGDFEVPWAEWLDPFTIVYASTEEDPGVRQIYTYNIRNHDVRQLTERSAYRYEFNLSPDKRYLVYAKTYFNEPYDLYRLNLERPVREVRLTNSVPDRFKEIDWQKEDYIRFTGRDGETELSMSVLYPPDFDSNYEYPVVVFFHGAGSLQNVYKGWSDNYWREYLFHQFLTLHGYVVVEVDFRHSTGYGRKFREDVTNWMGKYETEDTIDGLDWLQKNIGGLDLDRVGSYGGSYGGFMALYATSAEPERFHAAAALRAVTNWRNYYYANPWYTKPRLGTPTDNPDHYDRSSPLTYASEMEHPVLILHGLMDDNVGFQDAVQYIEELIQSGHEDFEMMMYPSERHAFSSPAAWYDEYRRIFEFFEQHLKD
jgi:dipeptidyl aminopeptidase/acylaminoacyl peptidase